MATISDYINAIAQLGLTIKKRTATGASAAVTCNGYAGKITTEALTTAAAAAQAYTITNNKIKADSVVLVSIGSGTNTQGAPVATRVTPAAGSVAILIENVHASEALNGTLQINFVVH